jgi:uncharacterized oligopeptide transporter (OPT) family protein
MQLPFPSGLAVANILRALTDKELLKQSILKLFGGTVMGFIAGVVAAKSFVLKHLGLSEKSIQTFDDWGLNVSTVGAGMVVGARIAIPGLVVGAIGWAMTPWLRAHEYIKSDDPFRKIGFIVALGTILGAAIVDLVQIGFKAVRHFNEKKATVVQPSEDWKKTNSRLLMLWVLFWAGALIFTTSVILHQSFWFVAFGIGLVFIFLLVNGIAAGISDQNPISSAFVIAVVLMALLGLKSPETGLYCAAILLISCAVGVDMQQDRSTGWRLGTNRKIQFRYQVIGILMGSVMAVVLTKLFIKSYPVLSQNQFAGHVDGAQQWQSTMTFKLVGALDNLVHRNPHVTEALLLGLALGIAIEVIRKVVKSRKSYQQFSKAGRVGKTTDFIFDAVIMPSPYASSLGGFVEFPVTVWFALGGVTGSLMTVWQDWRNKLKPQSAREGLPEDMSSNSLVGGGLIAGDSLAALALGIYGLIKQLT